jgi:N-glycosylase/DNA lyase
MGALNIVNYAFMTIRSVVAQTTLNLSLKSDCRILCLPVGKTGPGVSGFVQEVWKSNSSEV